MSLPVRIHQAATHIMHPAMATINEHQSVRSRNGSSRQERRLGRTNSREDPYLPSNRPRRRDALPIRLPSRDSKQKRSQKMLSRAQKEQKRQQQQQIMIQKQKVPPNSPYKLLQKTPSSSTLSTANSSFSDLANSSFGSSFSSGCSLDDIAPAPTELGRQSRWGESSSSSLAVPTNRLTPPATPSTDTPLRSIPRRRPCGSPSSPVSSSQQQAKRNNNCTQNSLPPIRRSSLPTTMTTTTTNISSQQQQHSTAVAKPSRSSTKARAVRTLTHPSSRAAAAAAATKANNYAYRYKNRYNNDDDDNDDTAATTKPKPKNKSTSNCSALGRVLAAMSDDETDDHVFVRRTDSNKGLSNMSFLLAEDTTLAYQSFPVLARRRLSVDGPQNVFATSSQKNTQKKETRTSHSLRGRRTTGSIPTTIIRASHPPPKKKKNSNSENTNSNASATIDDTPQRRFLVGDLVRALEESEEETGHIFCSRRNLFSYASDDES